jgi:hypothetical protein
VPAPIDPSADSAVPFAPIDPRPPSAFSLWRRRLSPLVILFAIFVLGRESCAKKDSAPVVVKLSVTQYSREVSMLRGELRRSGQVITSFERQAVAGNLGTIELKIPGGASSGSAHLEVYLHNKMIEIDRNFEAPPGSTVTIDVSDELVRRLSAP